MSHERPKISTEDEARLIFEEARSRLGEPDGETRVERASEVPNTDRQQVMPEPTPIDEKYAVDDRLVGLAPRGRREESGNFAQPDPLPSIGSTAPSDIGDSRSTDVRPQVVADPLLRDSPRDALRRLQRKADEARLTGVLE